MTENPYRLARDIRGIGFRSADAIAMKLGMEKTAMVRVRAGVGYALTFDPATQTLSGTPGAAVAAATYTYTATDADGDTASLTFTMAVGSAPLAMPGFGTATVAAQEYTVDEAIAALTLYARDRLEPREVRRARADSPTVTGRTAMSVKPLIMMTIAGLLAPILFGCGGGGDDGVSGPAFGTYARGNPTAEDLLDHWDDPERLRSALGLWAVANIAESRAAIRALLEEGAGGATIGTRAMLRNVQPEDIVVVGERDGITYGQWKGGPAGTLNIEFDWRFAENVDAESRVRMERAGKLWSRRVMDDFGTHVAATGTQVVHGDIRKTLDEEITTNGLVIFVLDKGPTSDRISSGGPGYFFVTADDLEPWLGSILLNRRHHDDTRVMAHEIGHVLGIGSTQNFPSVGRHVNRENHSFEGPEAMRANGGAPVMEQLDYNLLFRWFVGLSMDAPVWEAAQAHRGRVRLDQDHRRPGQDPASRARPGGLDVHAHRRRLQPGPAAQTARRGADMMPHSRSTHPKTRHERAANFDPRRP